VAVVQYTFTHKQYIEQHNRHKQYIEQHSSLIRKSADRTPSLRYEYTLAFALQVRKKHGKPLVRVAGECQLAKIVQNRAYVRFQACATKYHVDNNCVASSGNFLPTFLSFGFLTAEDGTDRLSRNFGKKLPLLAA